MAPRERTPPRSIRGTEGVVGAALPYVVLGQSEVIHGNPDAAPPTRAHDGRQVVAVREEVLRRPDAQGVAGYFPVPRAGAAGFDDGALNDVAHRAPANWPVNAPPMAQLAEGPGNFGWLGPEPALPERRAALRAVDEPPAAVGVGLAAPDEAPQPRTLECHVGDAQRREFTPARQEVIPEREQGPVAGARERVGLRRDCPQQEGAIDAAGLPRRGGAGAAVTADRDAVGLAQLGRAVAQEGIDPAECR